MQRALFNKWGHTCGIVVLAILLAGVRTAQAQDTSAPDSSHTKLLTPAKSNEGKWGYKDASGVYRIQPQFDAAMRFSEGLAAVALHKKVGYIDTTGKILISPQFVDGEPFHEGLALVYTTWGMNIFGTEGWDLFRRAGYIDQAGKIVIGPRLAENAKSFSEGVAAFQPGVASPGNAKWGYLDKTGEWAIKPRFEIASDFSEGLAAVEVSVGKATGQEEPTYKWGSIDHSGNFAIPPQFDGAMPFRNGIAVVSVRTQDSPLRRPRCIDKQGNAIKWCPPAPRPGEIPGKASAPISPETGKVEASTNLVSCAPETSVTHGHDESVPRQRGTYLIEAQAMLFDGLRYELHTTFPGQRNRPRVSPLQKCLPRAVR